MLTSSLEDQGSALLYLSCVMLIGAWSSLTARLRKLTALVQDTPVSKQAQRAFQGSMLASFSLFAAAWWCVFVAAVQWQEWVEGHSRLTTLLGWWMAAASLGCEVCAMVWDKEEVISRVRAHMAGTPDAAAIPAPSPPAPAVLTVHGAASPGEPPAPTPTSDPAATSSLRPAAVGGNADTGNAQPTLQLQGLPSSILYARGPPPRAAALVPIILRTCMWAAIIVLLPFVMAPPPPSGSPHPDQARQHASGSTEAGVDGGSSARRHGGGTEAGGTEQPQAQPAAQASHIGPGGGGLNRQGFPRAGMTTGRRSPPQRDAVTSRAAAAEDGVGPRGDTRAQAAQGGQVAGMARNRDTWSWRQQPGLHELTANRQQQQRQQEHNSQQQQHLERASQPGQAPGLQTGSIQGIQATGQGATCPICMERAPCVGFVHGRTLHGGFCEPCADRVMQSFHPKCPVCNQRAERAVQIFDIN